MRSGRFALFAALGLAVGCQYVPERPPQPVVAEVDIVVPTMT